MLRQRNFIAFKCQIECIQSPIYMRTNLSLNAYNKTLYTNKLQRFDQTTEPIVPQNLFFYTSMRLQKYRAMGRRKENYRRVCRAPYTCKGAEQQPYNSKTPTTSNEIIGVFFQSRRATERESVHALSANSQPHPTDRQILSQRSTLNTSLPTDTT